MARKPRPPRAVSRSSEPPPKPAASPPLFRRFDKRQPDLFRPAPAFIPPCKPVLRDRVPTGPQWQYEIKHDGYRVQAHACGGTVRLFSKSGRDYADRLPGIRDALEALGRELILDGEAVIVGPDGASDFFALHAAISAGHAPDAVYVAFDLLELDGEDIRERPLAERRAVMAEVLVRSGGGIGLSEHMLEDGPTMLRHACAMGLEGIVAKRRDRPYRSGYREDWLKVKCTVTEPFGVVGFDPARRRGVASLKLATFRDEMLVPCGSVGSGIDEAASRELRAALDAGRYVVVDVEHRGFTPAGELRHPVFRGWHEEE